MSGSFDAALFNFVTRDLSIARLPEQEELFDASELPQGMELLEPVEKQAKRFTGEMVKRNAARYAAIVGYLGQNISVRTICRSFGVSHHVVKAIRERDPQLVATEKQRFAKLMGHVARMCVETYAEALVEGTVAVQNLPIHAAIFTDKRAQLDGEATQRIEVIRRTEHTVEQVLADLKAIDVTEVVTRQNVPIDPPSDVCSEGKVPNPPGNAAVPTMVTTPATSSLTPIPIDPTATPDLGAEVSPESHLGAEPDGGGGGGPEGGPVGQRPMGFPERKFEQKDL